jgi:3-oxoacyl-[acyl-carrier-protein] synthase II
MERPSAWINGIGIICAQDTADPGFLPEVKEYTADFLSAINTDYKQFINPIAGRRMSRLIKMGITSARLALLDAHCEMPDAIITGTGLGSVEDTEKLLAEITADQNILNPTPFIQSTYNTISSQVAINLKCNNYNSTYVHRGFSFESALQDGLMQIEDGSAGNILAGGIDEMTLIHLNIIRRLKHWKTKPVSNLSLLDYSSPGALAGEGAAFFSVGKERSSNSYCAIRRVRTLYKPAGTAVTIDWIKDTLNDAGILPANIDLVIMGYNGDKEFDEIYNTVYNEVFPDISKAWFKHLSGEYYTAMGVALWLGANILKRQVIPQGVRLNEIPVSSVKNVVIYNQYRNESHSLILLSSE